MRRRIRPYSSRIGRTVTRRSTWSPRADGKDIAPLYLDVTTAIFRATAARGGTVHWDIDVRAAPDYVDVLTFASL